MINETPQAIRCTSVFGASMGDLRIDVFTLLEIRGVITGLEATGAEAAIHLLKRLHNRVVYLEAQELERKESK